ncbi:hypothetical protein SAMN05661010_02158 [Modicisalibacter muralis]|uniref:Uncharacterized protein n=1 Tax=Modicisalibacter muralis TaxID=119000 RepID=A0A1G9LMD4_9GAMM|nr:hypothetical protein SAMN05661010_02158 [Halomonas muralis]
MNDYSYRPLGSYERVSEGATTILTEGSIAQRKRLVSSFN